MTSYAAGLLRPRVSFLALAASIGLVACGGGGSSTPAPSPTPAPSNSLPQFNSSSAVTVAENTTGAIYTASASDADGDAVSFSIVGGSDADLFTLSANQLAFRSAPNFDLFGDSDEDNVYSVTLQASDGRGGRTNLALQVSVTNLREGISVSRLATGFGNDALVAPKYNSDALIVARQDGQLIGVDADNGATTLYGNLFNAGETGRVLAIIDTALVTLAVLDTDDYGILLRGIDASGRRNATRGLVARSGSPAGNPRPTAAVFGNPQNPIYVTLGDPAGDWAQDSTIAYGKLIEVQVDPYCGASLYTTCISARTIGDGIHAPGGAALVAGGATLFDRGFDRQEEITYFNPAARPLDFGWPAYEGSFARIENPPAQVNGPSIAYNRGEGPKKGTGIIGGVSYAGPIESLADMLLFGDISGKIFAAPLSFLSDGIIHSGNQFENRTADFAPDAGAIDSPRAILTNRAQKLFILDADGELFVVSD